MQRRSFLTGLIALASAGAAGLRPQPLAASEAIAPSGSGPNDIAPERTERTATLPDGTPADWSQSRRHDPWYWDRHHRRRRRRRVCRTHWDRWGRRYTRCRWV